MVMKNNATELPIVRILGLKVHKVTPEGAMAYIHKALQGDCFHQVVTLNAEIAYNALGDDDLKSIIENASLVTPDGNGIVWASHKYGEDIKDRVCGIDLLTMMLDRYNDGSCGFYFLGANPEVACKAKEIIRQKYPLLKYCGYHDGYFDRSETPDIIKEIKDSGADVLIVAMGAPYQDIWLSRYGAETGAKIGIGVGGSLDVISGNVNRAPVAFQKLKVEWLYRLIREPRRWKRMLALPKFRRAVKQDTKKL